MQGVQGPVAVFLAEGFEEIEALTVIDVLRRAEMPVVTVGVFPEKADSITGAHGVAVVPDTHIGELGTDELGMLVLPGGMPGTTNLQASAPLQEALLAFDAAERPIAAICAAPMVLGGLGILEGRSATIYPGMEAELRGARASQDAVVIDGHITTSRGPGTALAFALALASRCRGEQAARTVAEGMLVP